MRPFICRTAAPLCALVLLLLAQPALPAPYMTPEELSEMQPVWDAGAREAIFGVPDGGLDEWDDYVLTVEQVNVLDWLTAMQEMGAGPNYGGMHEGETSTWNIIQTDNTAEACRDWSHYARMTGDLTRYAQNIAAAWQYQFTWPAYSEEGGGNPNYYRCHNAGWALVAAMEYTEAYGDDPDVLAYADSCANYLTLYPLPPSSQLNAYSGSYGAGCLYTYAQWRGTPEADEWTAAAQDWAEDMKTYATNNTWTIGGRTWAMSGGTLIWGIATALFLDDPDYGAQWLPTITQYLPTYSGPANWNNSHTVWNGFAWHRIHQVLGDDDSLDNARFVLSYMFDQMYLDNDSGVPGTEGTSSDDQSWTTAYTVWYELEQEFSYFDTPWDAVAMEIVEPGPGDLIQLGDAVDVTVRIANGSLEPLGGAHELVLEVRDQNGVIGQFYPELDYGEELLYTLPSPWVPSSLGINTLTAEVSTADDHNPDNDTVSEQLEVQSNYSVVGTISDAVSGEGVHARIMATPTTPGGAAATTETDPASGDYTLFVLPDNYLITVLPMESPYPPRRQQITVSDEETVISYALPRAEVMYVINGPLSLAATGLGRMQQLFGPGFDPCVWPMAELGWPLLNLTAEGMNRVFWSHLTPESPLFSAEQYEGLNEFLGTPGTLFVLSGMSVMNVISFEERLRLGVAPGQLDMTNRTIASTPPDVLGGDSLFVQLPANLTQNDAVTPFHPNALRVGYYAGTNLAAGQRVAWPDGGRSVTLGFPLEACDPNRGWFAGPGASALRELLGVSEHAGPVANQIAVSDHTR